MNYSIHRSGSLGGPYVIIASTTGLNYDDTSVQNGVRYYYVIKAVSSVGESASSNEASATPQGAKDSIDGTTLLLIVVALVAGGIILATIAIASKKRKTKIRSSKISGESPSAISWDISQGPKPTSNEAAAVPPPVPTGESPAAFEKEARYYCQSCDQYYDIKDPGFITLHDCPICRNLLSYVIDCPNCHVPITLSKEVYAKFKGKMAECPSCKGQVVIE
nr:hypothetical protein [Candidatus Sigynarchaeum springense]